MRYREFIPSSQHLLIELADPVKQQLKNKWARDPSADPEQFDEYLAKWEKYSPQGIDISTLTFSQVKQLIDDRDAVALLKKGRADNDQEHNADTQKDLLYDQNGLQIYVGDSKNKCIHYGQSYSWCISSPKEKHNLYNTYRLYHNRTFYFVFDHDRSPNDPLHAVVIHVEEFDSGYFITDAKNSADREVSWSQITQAIPKLDGLKHIFVHRDLSENELKQKKYQERISDKEFTNLPLSEKIKYVLYLYPFTKKQQDQLPRAAVSYWAKRIDGSLLSQNTWGRLSFSDFKYVYNRLAKEKNKSKMPGDNPWLLSLISTGTTIDRDDFADTEPMEVGFFLESKGLDEAKIDHVRHTLKQFPGLSIPIYADRLRSKPEWPQSKQWPEVEQQLDQMQKMYVSHSVQEAWRFASLTWRRVPQAEAEMIEKLEPSLLIYYAIHVLKHRWVEAENKIFEKSHKSYSDFYRMYFDEDSPVPKVKPIDDVRPGDIGELYTSKTNSVEIIVNSVDTDTETVTVTGMIYGREITRTVNYHSLIILEQ